MTRIFLSRPAFFTFLTQLFFSACFLGSIFGFFYSLFPKFNFNFLLAIPICFTIIWLDSESVTIKDNFLYRQRLWRIFRHKPIKIITIKEIRIESRATIPAHHMLILTFAEGGISQIQISNFSNSREFIQVVLESARANPELHISPTVTEFLAS